MRRVRTATWRSTPISAVSRCASVLMVSVMLAVTSSSHAEDGGNSSDGTMILNLTTKDFDAAVAEEQHLFVDFCE